MRAVRRTAQEDDPPVDFPRDLPCHGGRDNQDNGHGHEAVCEGAVRAWQQQIGVRNGRKSGADGGKGPRRLTQAAPAPGRGKAGERVANWARHRRAMMADSAISAQLGRKWLNLQVTGN